MDLDSRGGGNSGSQGSFRRLRNNPARAQLNIARGCALARVLRARCLRIREMLKKNLANFLSCEIDDDSDGDGDDDASDADTADDIDDNTDDDNYNVDDEADDEEYTDDDTDDEAICL